MFVMQLVFWGKAEEILKQSDEISWAGYTPGCPPQGSFGISTKDRLSGTNDFTTNICLWAAWQGWWLGKCWVPCRCLGVSVGASSDMSLWCGCEKAGARTLCLRSTHAHTHAHTSPSIQPATRTFFSVMPFENVQRILVLIHDNRFSTTSA